MKDVREEWFDAGKKVKVTFADVTAAAQFLANGHLCGPVAAHYLAEGRDIKATAFKLPPAI